VVTEGSFLLRAESTRNAPFGRQRWHRDADGPIIGRRAETIDPETLDTFVGHQSRFLDFLERRIGSRLSPKSCSRPPS